MIKVTSNDKGRVKGIDRINEPSWVEDRITALGTNPPLPKWMLPIVNNYVKGTPITKNIVVIPCSGQYWGELNFRQRGKILELVEWLGGDADEYVKDFEAMYPNDGRRR